MERAQRIARINVLMRQRQGVTMAQLIEDLSVKRATINRDLALMRDQMHAPIVWDRHQGHYRLEAQDQIGPAYMLPGLWFTPQQAYAFLTMQNMVEKIAPNLLGPFLYPVSYTHLDVYKRQGVYHVVIQHPPHTTHTNSTPETTHGAFNSFHTQDGGQCR